MAGPAEYRVLRQTRWGEQTVYMVLHLQQSETFHVIDEPVGWSAQGLDHPALPRHSIRHEGNGIRQTWLPLLTGERLTERRAQGGLTGSEMACALEAAAAALQHLVVHRPEGVPAVIDPDCLCRAPSGEWVVDYALLAHNPEVRRDRQPAGVYAIGLLFFWLVTGEFPRLGRPSLTGRFPPLSTTLLLPLIKAINESYPGLPELQQALIDCRRAGGFDRLAEYLARPVKGPKLFGGGRKVAKAGTPDGHGDGVEGASVGSSHGVELDGRAGTDSRTGPESTASPRSRTGLGSTMGAGAGFELESTPGAGAGSEQGSIAGAGSGMALESTAGAESTTESASGTGLGSAPKVAPAAKARVQRGLPTGTGPWVAHDPKTATETLVGLAGRPLATPPPEIPLRDPSWAPAPWQMGDLPRRPAVRRLREGASGSPWLRPILLGSGGAAVLLLITLAVVRPWQAPTRLPETNLPVPTPDSPMGPSPRLGTAARLTPWEEDRLHKRWSRWRESQAILLPDEVAQPGPPDSGAPSPPVNPPPGNTPPTELPPLPAVPTPEPGTLADLDRQAGGKPHMIYINGREAGWAWLFAEGGPYLSLGAFNELFHRTLYWVPLSGNRVRILNATFAVETGDVQVIRGRLWLRMTPALQEALSVTLTRTTEDRLFFQDS